METLAWLEETALSIWLRESGPAFFGSLILHALAMGFVVGINIAIGLRLAGFATSIPLQPLRKFYPLHWACVAIIVCSGIALLLAYPAKALTNPVFYVKLAALTTALSISRHMQVWLGSQISSAPLNQPAPTGELDIVGPLIRNLALLSLLLWLITITAGRFLAYTNSVMLASRFF